MLRPPQTVCHFTSGWSSYTFNVNTQCIWPILIRRLFNFYRIHDTWSYRVLEFSLLIARAHMPIHVVFLWFSFGRKKNILPPIQVVGAGDETWTRTGFLPWDFKSQMSAYSITPAYVEIGGLHIAKRINARKHVVNPKRWGWDSDPRAVRHRRFQVYALMTTWAPQQMYLLVYKIN